MEQTFDIEKFREPSPWLFILVRDVNESGIVEEKTFLTQHDGEVAFAKAKAKRSTYSCHLWRHNYKTNECVEISAYDCGE